MHRHPASSLALSAFGIRCVKGARVSGLKLQLGDVAVEQDETLLAQQDPIREAQPIDHSLWPAGPRA
jgi:hypothetical protein